MPRIDRILCPVDFSDASRHAVEQAVAIAEWYAARLQVLHVYSPIFMPVPALPAPVERVSDVELERVREETRRFVGSQFTSFVEAGVSVDIGQPAAVILDRAARVPADLIVMGTHGAGGFEHLLLGSVTEKVLRKAPCPVLTVPPHAHVTSRFPFTHVLCAIDFSDWSAAALELASSLAQEAGATLELLHVIEWPWEEPPPPIFAELPAPQSAALLEFRGGLVAKATASLESLARDTVRDRCPVTVQVAHGKAYVQLLRIAADNDADLIVLGVHGRNPIDLAVFGSTTNQVVRRATCPVLTVRR
jgi:nucleotide-binding universal stress UspA family protein